MQYYIVTSLLLQIAWLQRPQRDHMEKNLNTNTRYGQLNRVINLLLLRLFSGLLLPYYKYVTAIRVPFKQEQIVICPEITVHVNDPYLTFTLQKFITIKEGIIIFIS